MYYTWGIQIIHQLMKICPCLIANTQKNNMIYIIYIKIYRDIFNLIALKILSIIKWDIHESPCIRLFSIVESKIHEELNVSVQ